MERPSVLAWKTMHEVTNGKSTPLKSKAKTERIQSWYNQFKNLGKDNSDAPDLSSTFLTILCLIPSQFNTSQFTLEELQTCLAKMSKQKASGPDNIPTMLWKDHNFHTELLYFCHETLEGNKPSPFSKSNMISMPKKVDLSQPLNYRGITLTSIVSKVYNSLLLNRISKHFEPILRRDQNGFRKGRSALPQILALRELLKRSR